MRLRFACRAFFVGRVPSTQALADVGDDGDGEWIRHGLAGGGVDGDPVVDRMAVHLVPRLHGEFGELAGFAIDHAGAEFRFIEENLQAHGIVAGGFHVKGRRGGNRLDGSGLGDRWRGLDEDGRRGGCDRIGGRRGLGIQVVIAAERQGAEDRAGGLQRGSGRLLGWSERGEARKTGETKRSMGWNRVKIKREQRQRIQDGRRWRRERRRGRGYHRHRNPSRAPLPRGGAG